MITEALIYLQCNIIISPRSIRFIQYSGGLYNLLIHLLRHFLDLKKYITEISHCICAVYVMDPCRRGFFIHIDSKAFH